MQGFYITIKNGLLEKKHVEAIGESVWLFLWLLDKMTAVDAKIGEGKVLGGRPIRFEEVNESLGISRATYKRWVSNLRDAGYIKTTRTPYGMVVLVNKTVKIFGKRRLTNEPSLKRDGSNKIHQWPKNEPSVARIRAITPPQREPSNKTRHYNTVDNTVDNTGGKPPAHAGVVIEKEEQTAMAFILIWNRLNKRNFKAHKPIMANLKYWMGQYTKEEIIQAVRNVRIDKYWKDKMEPVTFLRRKNPRGEEVDYIGKFLNAESNPENLEKKSEMMW